MMLNIGEVGKHEAFALGKANIDPWTLAEGHG